MTKIIADKILNKLKKKTDAYLDGIICEIAMAVSKTAKDMPPESWDRYRQELEKQVLLRLGGYLLGAIGQRLDDSSNRATKKVFHHIRFHAVQMLT